MNKHILLATALFTLAVGAAQAQVYTELSGGAGKISGACTDAGSGCKDRSATFRGTVGYELSETIGVDVSVVSLPSVKLKDADGSGKASFRGFQFGGSARVPLTEQLSFDTRAGVALIHMKGSYTDAGRDQSKSSDRSTGPYIGVGASYALTKTQSLGVMLEFSRMKFDGDKANANTVQATWRARF